MQRTDKLHQEAGLCFLVEVGTRSRVSTLAQLLIVLRFYVQTIESLSPGNTIASINKLLYLIYASDTW